MNYEQLNKLITIFGMNMVGNCIELLWFLSNDIILQSDGHLFFLFDQKKS